VVQDATSNLLSLRELLKFGERFEGDRHTLSIFASNGDRILSARDRGDGFWTCTKSEVKQLVATAMLTQPPQSFSAEERSRAQQAFNLCRLLGHPSDQALISLLDNGNMMGTALTSQDLRTARHLFGPCPASVEGKMRAPSLPSSVTPPATKIGISIL
jgi:hypothetical protein